MNYRYTAVCGESTLDASNMPWVGPAKCITASGAMRLTGRCPLEYDSESEQWLTVVQGQLSAHSSSWF
jgi:hypothetical protein